MTCLRWACWRFSLPGCGKPWTSAILDFLPLPSECQTDLHSYSWSTWGSITELCWLSISAFVFGCLCRHHSLLTHCLVSSFTQSVHFPPVSSIQHNGYHACLSEEQESWSDSVGFSPVRYLFPNTIFLFWTCALLIPIYEKGKQTLKTMGSLFTFSQLFSMWGERWRPSHSL